MNMFRKRPPSCASTIKLWREEKERTGNGDGSDMSTDSPFGQGQRSGGPHSGSGGILGSLLTVPGWRRGGLRKVERLGGSAVDRAIDGAFPRSVGVSVITSGAGSVVPWCNGWQLMGRSTA